MRNRVSILLNNFQAALDVYNAIQGSLKIVQHPSSPMERQRLAANTSNIALLICQYGGEPPTLHRLQLLQRFQPEIKFNAAKKQTHLVLS